MFKQIPSEVLRYEILPYMNPYIREKVICDDVDLVALKSEAFRLLKELKTEDWVTWDRANSILKYEKHTMCDFFWVILDAFEECINEMITLK